MTKTNKYICVHGHYYQPPRENAWLESIELQESAQPFHDWNARINFECYAPNRSARILDAEQRIVKIVNNYARMSFNIGPTLMSWLEQEDIETYKSIVEADKISQVYFNGHGSAIAQVHGHLILPLANERDKHTQILWGIQDFKYRFGRKPEGMWLSETAINTATMEVLVAHGIKYTILAPRQAKAFRKTGESHWHNIHNDSVETRRPYWCVLPSGRKIALFFYNGVISQGVAFDGLLNDGKRFADRLSSNFDDNDVPQLTHIATDGESYGHHHRFGEMALASCLNEIDNHSEYHLTNYGEFLEKFPPEYEIQIHENSSWSCAHGVERWRSDCSCKTRHDWHQRWRAPLRDALNWLRDALIPVYETEAKDLFKDVWAARNAYIQVVLNRSPERIQAFFNENALKPLSEPETVRALRLLEMQRHAMLMFTSCGWFFDEISGIETNQILQYACRAINYATQLTGIELQTEFTRQLSLAPSNVYTDGAESYRTNVLPAIVNLEAVGIHYAIAALFEPDPDESKLFNYQAESDVFEKIEMGLQKLVVGRITIRSRITLSRKLMSFAVLYLGQQHVIGSISTDMSREKFDNMQNELRIAFKSTNLAEVITAMHSYFGMEKYTIRNLFRDEKLKILQQITDFNLLKSDASLRDIYTQNYQLMTMLLESQLTISDTFKNIVRYVLNADLNRFFEKDTLNITELTRLVSELQKWKIELSDKEAFILAAGEDIFKEINKLLLQENSRRPIEKINRVFQLLKEIGIQPEIWKSQNAYLGLLQTYQAHGQTHEQAQLSHEWQAAFKALGQNLMVRIE
jgi:alpha-amylase/alpha-mannosidase (GH57 family)